MSTISKSRPKSKIDLVFARLQRPGGAIIDDLVKTTGWQMHSVRAAMAGTLRKKRHGRLGEDRRRSSLRLIGPAND